jgi:hypothetical protein
MRSRHARSPGPASRRILFPFLGSELSEPSLEAALRLSETQRAILMPAYLAIVPRGLALEAPMGAESERAMAMLELIEQRASRARVEVDARIERGRTARQALERLLETERFDTLVLPARTSSSDGFEAADIAWILDQAPGEVLVLRPAPVSE